ncbi:MAG: response regulator transcription factor [Angustibacter sp.]
MTTPGRGGGEPAVKVLVVSGHPTALAGIVAQLRQVPAVTDVLTVADGDSALELLDRCLPAGADTGGPSTGGPSTWMVEILTAREVQVVEAVACGLSNANIGRSLFLTEKTVKNHLNRIFAKVAVRSRTELVAAWHGTQSVDRLGTQRISMGSLDPRRSGRRGSSVNPASIPRVQPGSPRPRRNP